VPFSRRSDFGNLVTNDDNREGNTATFFSIDANRLLTQIAVVPVAGTGAGGGAFATPRIAVSRRRLARPGLYLCFDRWFQ